MRDVFRGKAALVAAVIASIPASALADGLEYAGMGARGTMRGGAYVVGSDDAMALAYNPANLARVHGMQLHASIGLLFYSSCYNRDGTYGSSAGGINRGGAQDLADAYGAGAVATNTETGLSDGAGGTLSFDDIRNIPNPEVCNNHKVNVVPELSYAWRLSERIGVGLGIVAPTAPGNLAFGQKIDGRDGMIRSNGLVLPAPSRYMMTDMSALIAFPTVGVGIEVVDKVRVGASFGWGFANINFGTTATPYYSEDIAMDIHTHVHVKDRFIPRVSAGISAGPWSGFSTGASFTYYGDINASGTLLGSSLYNWAPADRSMYIVSATIPNTTLQTSLPWQLVAGARYADERTDVTLPTDAIGDSLDTENWNVEFDVGWSRGSRLQGFDVGVGNVAIPRNPDGSVNTTAYPCALTDPTAERGLACLNLQPNIPAGVPQTLPSPVRHNWKDQITLRIGGDYNVVPGRFSVSGGFSYDSNGQQSGYQQLDFQPFRRIGLHTGFTVRVSRWDLFVAYAHHFNKSQRVHSLDACPSASRHFANDANGDGDLLDPGEQESCDAPPPNGNTGDSSDSDWGLHQMAAVGIYSADVVNSGRFRSHLDVVQLGATYHFR